MIPSEFWGRDPLERFAMIVLFFFRAVLAIIISNILIEEALLLTLQVYLMRDKVRRNFVCVKVIKIKNIPKKEREATKVEVDLLRRLHHPNIVRYIDSFLSKNNESLCICMEYCDGVSFGCFGILFEPHLILVNFIRPFLGGSGVTSQSCPSQSILGE
jgi:serine/threonine protein kinase